MSNNTNTTFYIKESLSSYVVRVILIVCVLVAAFLGNLIVIRAICQYPGRKPLAYILVLNLAVGEVLNVLTLAFFLFYEQTVDWVFGEFLCIIITPLQVMCLTNVTVTLAAIAVYRWRVLTVPYKRILSPLKTKLLIGSFWFVGATLAVPLLWMRDLKRKSDGRMRCSWKSDQQRGRYTIAHQIVCYVIPFVIVVAAYTKVGLKLQKHIVANKRNQKKHSEPSCPTVVLEIPLSVVHIRGNATPRTPNESRHRESLMYQRAYAAGKNMVEMEHDLIRMMYIIVFSFIVCYIPYQLFFILGHGSIRVWHRWRHARIVAGYFMWLTLLPSSLHPLIYGTKSKFFAKAFSSLVACRKWRN